MGKDHADSFLLLESGRADAFVMDGSILAKNIATSKNPKDFAIVGETLSVEPIACMLPKGDAKPKKAVDDSIVRQIKDGSLAKLYDQWFMQPIPPEPFEPHIYADISGAFDRKLQALRCHESQHPFLQSHHRSDFLGLVSAAAYLHGAACGVQYAEAFALCRRFNRPATIQALAGFFPPSR